MKIQIDTTAKTIRIDEPVKLQEFMTYIKKLFPKGEWGEYTLDATHITNWIAPITIDPLQPYYPQYPWDAPIYQVSNGGTTNGVFNFEINN